MGRRLKAAKAILPAFERQRRRHFYIVRRPGAATAGALLRGLADADFRVLDKYEEVPRLYTRRRGQVLAENSRPMECFVYLPTSLAHL